LSATATTVATAGQSFFNAMPSLKEISAETIHASKEARTDLQAHISQMESLTQTTDSTQSMVSTIDKQTENTERLTEELAQSRAEAALLKSQLDSIKKENALVKQNLQFFKEATKTLMAKQQLLTTDVGALTTQEVMPK
jgi:chromosome segregation ATPase